MKISCRDSLIKKAGPKERKRATGINFSAAEKNLTIGDSKPSREDIDAYIKTSPNIAITNEKLNLIQQLNLDPEIRKRVNENENFFLIVGSAICSKSDAEASNSIVLINWFLEFKEAKPGSLDLSSVNLSDAESIFNKFNELLRQMLQAKNEADAEAADSKKSDYLSHNVVYDFGDGWVVVYLPAAGEMPEFEGLPNTSHDRILEGNKNGLCLGSQTRYYQNNDQGKVYSLRSPGNKPEATIRINRNELMECKGKNNLVPKVDAARHAKIWFENVPNLKYFDCYDFQNFPPVDKESALSSFLYDGDEFFSKGWAASWFKNGIEEIDEAIKDSVARKDPTILVCGFAERYKEMTEPIAEDVARQYLDNPSRTGPWRIIFSCVDSNAKIFRKNPIFLQAERHYISNYEYCSEFFRSEIRTLPEYSDLTEHMFLKAITTAFSTILEIIRDLSDQPSENNNIRNLLIKYQDRIYNMIPSLTSYESINLINSLTELGMYSKEQVSHNILLLKNKPIKEFLRVIDDPGIYKIISVDNKLHNDIIAIIKDKLLSIDDFRILIEASHYITDFYLSKNDQLSIYKQIIDKLGTKEHNPYGFNNKGSDVFKKALIKSYVSNPNRYDDISIAVIDRVIKTYGYQDGKVIENDICQNLEKIIPLKAKSEPFNVIYMYYDKAIKDAYHEIDRGSINAELKKAVTNNLDLAISSILESADIYRAYTFLGSHSLDSAIYKFFMKNIFSKKTPDEWLETGKRVLGNLIISNADAAIKGLLHDLIDSFYNKDDLSNLLQIRELVRFAVPLAFKNCSPTHKVVLASTIKGVTGGNWSDLIDHAVISSVIEDVVGEEKIGEKYRKLAYYSDTISSLESADTNINFINQCANSFDIHTFITKVCIRVLDNSSATDSKRIMEVISEHIKRMSSESELDSLIDNSSFSNMYGVNPYFTLKVVIKPMLNANPYFLLKWIDDSFNLRLNANIAPGNSGIRSFLAMIKTPREIIDIVTQCIMEISNRNIEVNKQYVDDIAARLGIFNKTAFDYKSQFVKKSFNKLLVLAEKLTEHGCKDDAANALFLQHLLGVK